MPSTEVKTVGFAAVICVICSFILALASQALKPYQEFNRELDRKKNVLMAFGEDLKGKKAPEIEAIYNDNIKEIVITRKSGEEKTDMTVAELAILQEKEEGEGDPEFLPVYLWEEDGQVSMYAFPMEGYGLWSTVYSYMALDDTLSEIVGVTFYGHLETPGLGGECSVPWFMDQFKGKIVWKDNEYMTFEVVKNGVASIYPKGNDHAVDAISGATITSKGIEDFINQHLVYYQDFFNATR